MRSRHQDDMIALPASIKGPLFAVLEDDAYPRHPVGALPDDQVAHDFERGPGISPVATASFVAAQPEVGHPTQQRIQGCGSTVENCDSLGQAEFRHAWHAFVDAGLEFWTHATEQLLQAWVENQAGSTGRR